MTIDRLLSLPDDYSFMLFGPRGAGKSTLLEQRFDLGNSLYIDLLDPAEEALFALQPNELIALVDALPDTTRHVIIDEIQKVPRLLDVVHLLLEKQTTPKYFVLTGSSARKLKAGGVNLLAGRAFVYHLYPFSYVELGERFDLQQTLAWGTLPGLLHFEEDRAKQKFLQAYAQTYLKEEIGAEQLVKNLDPFRRFLEVAAQCNGKVINYSNIARDTGIDDKTVKNYFSLLEDTLLGVILEPFRHSFRKRLRSSPKFYFIDVGIARALARHLSVPPQPGTSYYGELFEQFIVTECIKLADYLRSEYKFSYLMTGAGTEIDLVVERPGEELLLIEIKSKTQVLEHDVSALGRIANDIGDCEAVCFSQDKRRKKLGEVMVYPWQEGIKRLFG